MRDFFRTLFGPLGIAPIGVAMCVLVLQVYAPPETTMRFESMLFLQGSTDEGGGLTYAVCAAALVAFGITSSFYLVLCFTRVDRDTRYPLNLLYALIYLTRHFAVLLLVIAIGYDDDSRIGPNDHRNLFLLATLIYGASILWIVGLVTYLKSFRCNLLAAPLFIYI